jgi:uncharacterized peroxidase-related enzyme
MKKFEVPKREQLSSANQAIFDSLKEKMGFVPNIYAAYALSENGLGRYLAFSNGKTSLSTKEKEAVNLVVSQVNGCRYCQAVHTAIGKMNGFSDDQIIELRKGHSTFNSKLDALVKLAGEIVENRGAVNEDTLDNFYDEGYTDEHLVDLIIAVGEKTITNYLHKITNVPIDFPEAPVLETVKS